MKNDKKILQYKKVYNLIERISPKKKEPLKSIRNKIENLEYENINEGIKVIEKKKKVLEDLKKNKKENDKQKILDKKIKELETSLKNEVKKNLHLVVKNALNNSIHEMEITGKDFKEEALRYIVMTELSKNGFWGTFPNKNDDKPKILFEKGYKNKKTDKRKKPQSKTRKSVQNRDSLFPDIVSISGEKYLLVIELKITSNREDIIKCLQYLDENKGRETYELATVIFAIPKKSLRVIDELINYTEVHFEKKQNKDKFKERLLVGLVQLDYNDENERYPDPIIDWIENFTKDKYRAN